MRAFSYKEEQHMAKTKNYLQELDEIDPFDSYFECITACYGLTGEDVECVTHCVAVHLEEKIDSL